MVDRLKEGAQEDHKSIGYRSRIPAEILMVREGRNMVFVNLSHSNIIKWCGLNKKRDFDFIFIDRAASGCDNCVTHKCWNCKHKALVNKNVPFVAHGRDSYYSTSTSFEQKLNKTQILILLSLYSCAPSDDGKVEYLQLSSLAKCLSVCKKTIFRNMFALAELGYISYRGISACHDIFYSIKITGYADTFKPVKKGGVGYSKISIDFIADLINAIVHESYDINTLRVVLYVIGLVLENSDCIVEIPRTMFYSFLPSYGRKSHLDKALGLLDTLGLLNCSKNKGYYIYAKLPDIYSVSQIEDSHAERCKRDILLLDWDFELELLRLRMFERRVPDLGE